jgi:hypothetical protein
MTRTLVVLCALAAGLSVASAQNTGPQNTQELYGMCRNERNLANQGLCLGYVSGIGDMMTVLGIYNKQKQIKGLVPWSMCGQQSYGAMMQAFVNWAQAHPEAWSENQAYGVMRALHEKWPCS